MSVRMLRIWRGSRDGGAFVDYELETEDGMVVLDAVREIQRTQAKDLAVRWNCKAAKCGSCAGEVNGKPRLMCKTRLDSLPPGEPIVVEPLRSFPVIRDLVTEVSWNYEVNKRIPPFTPKQDAEWLIGQADVDRISEFRKCIECFLCQNVCHVLREHAELGKYFGPRFMVRIASLEMHPLDALDRTELLHTEAGLNLCNITKCCGEVCPEQIRITDNAIIPLKERVADRSSDPLPRIARAIRRVLRPSPPPAPSSNGGACSLSSASVDPVATPARRNDLIVSSRASEEEPLLRSEIGRPLEAACGREAQVRAERVASTNLLQQELTSEIAT